MRRAIGLICVASLLAALPAGSAQGAPSKKKRCALKGTTTVKKNRFGRVFQRGLRNGDSRLYGCLYRKNRRVLLDTATGDRDFYGEYYEAIKLNGRFVAWRRVLVMDSGCRAQPECSPGDDGTSVSVGVGSLHRGYHKEYIGDPDSARALVVTQRGGIAYVDDGDVWGADARGERLLYEGGNARPNSLRTRGSTVSWLVDGRRMSAVLGGLYKKKRKPSCVVRRSKTVAQNRFARVYTLAGRPGTDEVGRLYGCLRSNNRKVRLDTAYDDDYVTAQAYNAVKLNGRFVAWQHSSTDLSCKADCPPGYEPTKIDLRVTNLRTRKKRIVDGTLGEGSALVVTRTGALAWIQPGSPVSVRADDADGSRVLYSGDDIDGGSLSLSGGTVAWIAGGTPMSATLR